MPDSDLPEGTAEDTALDFTSGVDAISDLLGDSDENPAEDDQGHETEEDTAETGPDDVEETDEGDGEATAEDDPVDGAEESDDSGSKGRFVSGDAKFRLDDGTVISVADLARNNLYQRDYTRKTTELSEKNKEFETQRQQVSQMAQELAQQRDFLLQVAPQFLPKPPDKAMLETDFIGYQYAQAEYAEKMNALQQLLGHNQAEQDRVRKEQEKAEQERINKEAERIVEHFPQLKNPESYNKFWGGVVNTMGEYGFSPQELSNSVDHRFFLVYRDLMELKRIKKAAPKVKEDVQKRPVMSAAKRMDPKAKISRDKEARANQLRKTGDFNSGVASLMDLDL